MSGPDLSFEQMQEHNQRLAAAAPDLANALQEMLAAFSMENIGIEASRRRLAAKKAARDALATARDG